MTASMRAYRAALRAFRAGRRLLTSPKGSRRWKRAKAFVPSSAAERVAYWHGQSVDAPLFAGHCDLPVLPGLGAHRLRDIRSQADAIRFARAEQKRRRRAEARGAMT